MDAYKKRQEEYISLYRQHEYTIDSVQNALRRETPQLTHEFDLSIQQVHMLNEYIDDRLTILQYLIKSKFSLPTTLSLLLDTIRWRLLNRIDSIRLSSVSHDFLNKPLVYFNKSDKLDRPLLIIHLAYLPTNIPDDDEDYLLPLVIFVLETARLLILAESNVFDINVLLDFKNTTTIPLDMTMLKSWSTLLSRYPGIIGTVNILNSSWIYQGLWKMCKLVLSNEAKSKMNMPTHKDLLNMIDSENLLQEFGGTDTFTWELSQDIYYTRYRPDIDPVILSRSSSSASIYYDLEPIEIHVQPPSPPTPLSCLTPVASHTNLTNLAKAYSSLSLSSKIGNGVSPRLRNTIKHVFNEATPEQPGRSWFRTFYDRLEQKVRLMLLRSLQRIKKYKGTVYWIIAGVLLRNGVQELCQHILLMMMEVVFIGQPSAIGNAVGMRKMLSLTIGQLTL